jgi:hypothetical protein
MSATAVRRVHALAKLMEFTHLTALTLPELMAQSTTYIMTTTTPHLGAFKLARLIRQEVDAEVRAIRKKQQLVLALQDVIELSAEKEVCYG